MSKLKWYRVDLKKEGVFFIREYSFQNALQMALVGKARTWNQLNDKEKRDYHRTRFYV